MSELYTRPKSILPTASSYCPGCLHATATRIIAEAIDELGQQDNVIYVLPVGCSTQGRPRPCSGCGHRHQALPSRLPGVLLPG